MYKLNTESTGCFYWSFIVQTSVVQTKHRIYRVLLLVVHSPNICVQTTMKGIWIDSRNWLRTIAWLVPCSEWQTCLYPLYSVLDITLYSTNYHSSFIEFIHDFMHRFLLNGNCATIIGTLSKLVIFLHFVFPLHVSILPFTLEGLRFRFFKL